VKVCDEAGRVGPRYWPIRTPPRVQRARRHPGSLTNLGHSAVVYRLSRGPAALAERTFCVCQPGYDLRVPIAASTVAVVAIAAAVIVVALVVLYVLPRGGRRKRSASHLAEGGMPPRAVLAML
jgi:hypothetical protein